uniref:Carbamoyl phosphate synthase small chain n=1 Tax=Bostrychia simpliciuscula TaxID=324754 RepID=A0A1Z1M7K6_9FLOR|nr:carbamoyl phosphate synthase small subunit [Bostrychia simpliciuscula]ARW61996.1 carbamoyl phosphate synthase small subunit [Bostrychia simpliciuscula]
MLNSFCLSSLYLQDGTCYKGWSFFDFNMSFGEIVFNTGITGYQEIMTDPSYTGQIVVFTYPEIGNTGLNYEDNESNFIHIKGLIAKNISFFSSSWRSDISLKEYIKINNIPHIFGIDTRALTKYLRLMGVMNGVIFSNSINNQFNYNFLSVNKKTLDHLDVVSKVTTKKIYHINNNSINTSLNTHLALKTNYKLGSNFTILVIDFGIKFNILRRLLLLGCKIVVVPATCNYENILLYKPDGLLLSNGPGNPALVAYSMNTVRKLVYSSNIPIFGICMGHQILNLALGVQTFKLKFGHRGLNHPSGLNNYSEITSQNHGFALDSNSLFESNLSKILTINHFNLNDFTVASVLHKNKPVFSVQYHPEASPGPHDADYLFKAFIQLIHFVKSKH